MWTCSKDLLPDCSFACKLWTLCLTWSERILSGWSSRLKGERALTSATTTYLEVTSWLILSGDYWIATSKEFSQESEACLKMTGKPGTITCVLGDGALASVRWDVSPNEEHQYRVGRFGRFELVVFVCKKPATFSFIRTMQYLQTKKNRVSTRLLLKPNSTEHHPCLVTGMRLSMRATAAKIRTRVSPWKRKLIQTQLQLTKLHTNTQSTQNSPQPFQIILSVHCESQCSHTDTYAGDFSQDRGKTNCCCSQRRQCEPSKP